ncbi:hypothetical protein KKB18_08890 [bacterium]|nr:hypothetical protein [bacterium]
MIFATSLIQDIYKFFDTTVILKSNSDKFLSLFKSIYKRFILESQSGIDLDQKREYVVLVEEEKNICQAYIDDQIYTTDCTASSFRFLFMLIIFSINNEIKSHFLFHAGAVAKNDKGFLFPAPPSLGKTTITLALIDKGCKLLTDDIAAFNRKTATLDSYARSFSVREDTIKLLNIAPSRYNKKDLVEDYIGDRKYMIDPEDFKENCITTNVPLSVIIFLEEQSSKGKKDQEKADRNLLITFSTVSKDFIDEIKKIHGIKEVDVISQDIFPQVKIVIRQHARVIKKLEALCSKFKIIIMNAQDSKEVHDYENEAPEIVEIQKSEAVIQLLKNSWNGSTRSSLLRQEYKGNISLLYLDLIEIIRNVKCYNLSLGKFDKMMEKILEKIDKG